MYAIVEISGQQFKVEQGQQIFVHRLEVKEGSKVDFDKVLLLDDKGKVNIGSPEIKGSKVTAKVLEHLKGDKVIVFKKKSIADGVNYNNFGNKYGNIQYTDLLLRKK